MAIVNTWWRQNCNGVLPGGSIISLLSLSGTRLYIWKNRAYFPGFWNIFLRLYCRRMDQASQRKPWLWFAVRKSHCDSPLGQFSLKQADPVQLTIIFNKYASVEKDGERYMTPENLIRDYLGMQKVEDYNKTTLTLLAGCVDQTKDGLISFSEFMAFEALLRDPGAQHKIVFQLFDLDGKGSVTFDEFENVIKKTTFFNKIKFNFDTEFVHTYFGTDKKEHVRFDDFSHLLQDLEKEYQRQAYLQSKMPDGEITAVKFAEIMKILRGHKLSPFVRNYLLTAASGEGGHRISYGYYRAFNTMLDHVQVLHDMACIAAKGNRFKELRKADILHEAKSDCEITPLVVDILFHLCDLENRRGRVTVSDVHQMIPHRDVFKVFSTERIEEEKLLMEPKEEEISILWKAVEQVYRFGLGSIAGAAGATAVYPIDLVKTRMQNQRAVLAHERVYANSFDCFFKVIRNEGPRGLYRGLLPQLVGVAPEKAIKLTTNDFVRDVFRDKDGFISLPFEIVAGGCGGAAQVLFTNPLEIVKIRLQVAGEVGSNGAPKVTALRVIKELGLPGLYKGARACFLRDIPFSGIYFPAYAHLKSYFADEKSGLTSAGGLFLAAMMAGVPAAGLCTPADVIKTRLQVKAREGQQTYRGVFDCTRKVWKEEGGRAFWKGAGARVFRSSPQFGVTLLTYEILQRIFKVDFSGKGAFLHEAWSERKSINPDISLHPDHIGGMRLAVASFAGIETRFGLCLPKFAHRSTSNPSSGQKKT
ncbi:electrogenic aspartate/glutamate antiporter SLC25A13, mitochondrial-like isoform X1 [Montipora capricornis]|uniref:electrogenic aspartate/glutamate antiporter SLC25A13, mitochondrial-like isoform X1 n=1 Tax=Montipora capricornis TaxID=246305 RepID=UPI0035F13416